MSVYREIARDLSRRIADGELAIGATLPPEADLAQSYDVARGTVRSALSALARAGVIVSRRGTGWVILSPLQDHGFGQLRSFAQWARSRGMVPGGRVVARAHGPARREEAERLRLERDAEVLRVVRMRSLDGTDVMLERTTYAPWVMDAVEGLDAETPSVTDGMDQAGIFAARTEHTIDAVAATSEDSRLLGVRRSSPLLRVLRVSQGRDGRTIEFADDRYLPGTVAFQMQSTMPSTPLTRAMA